MTSRPLDPRLEKSLKDWKICFFGYGIAHYTLVVVGILAGATVTASSAVATTSAEPFIQPIVTAVLGIIAAAAVAITNALDTGSQYRRFNNAWVCLNEAVLRYRNEANFPIGKVIDAWKTGQNIINQVPQQGQTPQRRD